MAVKTLLVIGPPGSGKGTQAELLAKTLAAVHLSSGQVLRDHASPKVRHEMEQGELVDEPEVEQILEQSLVAAPAESTWILDGFVRLPEDREWLEGALMKLGRSLDFVIIIDVPENICRERVMGRGRSDDTATAWQERWSEFEEVTLPVIESLTQLTHIRVDGSGDPESINNELIDQLAQAGIHHD